ncbi:TonB-dependent receptor plug domain-containing protein [Pseudogemmobacter sonorensis]|uniref:TonB-dependent receptor plug domain-containing protein n=1 Tax=Pseudogemmobacter sonorensis TaxID=2989681 RepID=UPI00367E9BB6
MQGISHIAILAALAATGFATGARAQERALSDHLPLGEITLSASTEARSLSQTGATVSVVTGEDLKKSGELSVAGQLARLPGVSMARNGGLGTSTALRLRGLAGPYIGVRIDGIDVADPSGTQCAYDFGSTTTGGISRIEVLRGSQSALYGSEAIGGVVDITSFRPVKDGVSGEAGLEIGSDATRSATASVGLKTERAELALTLSHTRTDGISAYAGGTEDDGFETSMLTLHAAYDLTDGIRIGFNGFARNSYTEFDGQTADNAETEHGRLRGGRLFVAAETGAVSHELSYARTETSRYYPLGWVQAYDGARDQIAYDGRWRASEQVSLNWGLDRTSEDFGAGSDRGKAWTTAVYSELLYAPTPDLDLSLALRRDDHEHFGGKVTGRAAIAWRPGQDWVIRAVASTGFRAPSLYEMYSAYGDTGLMPETSQNFELGAEYLLPGGSIQATLFQTTIDDKIGWDGSATTCASASGGGWPGCYAQIPGETRTRGIELTGSYQVAPGWTVFGNYTYADAVTSDAGVDTRLVRVPRHDLTFGVEGRLADRLSGVLTVQHVADFLDNGIWPAPVSAMPDYTLANLTLTYELNDAAQAYLRVENLFDEEYQTVRNYGQPGRQVFVGVRTSF